MSSPDLSRLPGPLRGDPFGGPVRAALHLVYDLAWLLAAVLGSPWLLWKSATTPGFGRMCLERLGWGLPQRSDADAPCIVVHGVSVGEVKAAAPVVRALRDGYPDHEVVVCSSTNTGMAVAREVFTDLRVARFPIDLSFVVRRFFRRLRPSCIVLVELEIWPNFLRAANRRDLPVAVVNGRITDRSHVQYQQFRRLLPQFNRLSLYCVQGEEYAERFLDLSVEPERLVVTGNVKADGLCTGRVDPGDELRRLLGGSDDQAIVVAGSTHDTEEGLVVDAWRASFPGARLVLVPRHPRRLPEIQRDLLSREVRPQTLTGLRRGDEQPDPARPAIVDTIGELERIYGLADAVFVGGSLVDHGGHNVLEPAAQGIPVLFGPHMGNFTQEMALLSGAGGCRQVGDAAELGAALGALLQDSGARARMGAAGLEAVEAQRGATELTLRALERVVLPARALSHGGASLSS